MSRRFYNDDRSVQPERPLRAAEYVRMSTDHQKYSTENQSDAIKQYAESRGIEIVRTYADAGKSGLKIEGRDALRQLIEDVQSGNTDFTLVLVYDISRWGCFQDADESAYYEYICRRSGIAVEYCAEQFDNDGSPISTIVKGVKRAMAGEYIHIAFDRDFLTIPVAAIVPLKTLPDGARASRSYSQVLSSIKAIGLIEAPVVMADAKNAGIWFLLDGHLRLEALKELGIAEVECLLTADDDTYTYNKRVNRIPPIQEHRTIVRAMDRGVPSTDIAAALNLQVESVLRRFRLLEGISPEAAEMLKDTPCSMKVFNILRQMTAVRQIEAADLMIGQNNFTVMFARALRAATSENQLATAKKGKGGGKPTPSGQQIARMERELSALQAQVRSVEETYGIDNLHLTVARGYIAKLLANNRVVRWLATHHQDYLSEFQKIAEIDTLGPIAETPGV